jgi:hypothetical protein
MCRQRLNQLDVVDVTNLSAPRLVRTYGMTNPHGLAKDGHMLFICDGKDGLRVFNASDPNNLVSLRRFEDMEAYDVIAMNGLALVVAKDGLYQYNYSNPNQIRFISKLPVAP